MRTTKIFFISLIFTLLFIQIGSALDWKEYSPSGSHVTLMMPKQPDMCIKKGVPTDSGPIDMYQVLADYGEYAFLFTFNDYPSTLLQQKNTDKILEDVVSGSVGDGELVKKGDIQLGSYRGKSYTCKKSGLEMKAFIYLVNQRLYQAIAVYPPDQSESLSNDVNSFLTSIKLNDSSEKPNDSWGDCASQ